MTRILPHDHQHGFATRSVHAGQIVEQGTHEELLAAEMRRAFDAPKGCEAQCTIACVRRASVYDEWRSQRGAPLTPGRGEPLTPKGPRHGPTISWNTAAGNAWRSTSAWMARSSDRRAAAGIGPGRAATMSRRASSDETRSASFSSGRRPFGQVGPARPAGRRGRSSRPPGWPPRLRFPPRPRFPRARPRRPAWTRPAGSGCRWCCSTVHRFRPG